MNPLRHALRQPVALLLLSLAAWLPGAAPALNLAQEPLFIASTQPRVMLLLSRDHELTKKAYTDYSDLDGDGILDTTYNNAVDYYGYFDSDKCYSYSGSRFEPSGTASSHYCNSLVTDPDTGVSSWAGTGWSGNFLNWASMTRMDVVRKVLYGGYRSTDSTGTTLGSTVLERHMLPNDVHAFAKVFETTDSAEIRKLTPYAPAADASGKYAISLCNVTDVPLNNTKSGSVNTATYPPLIKAASGSWPQWAMSEINQCIWREQKGDGLTTRPSTASRLSGGSDLIARVAVCAPNLLEGNCKSYYTRAATPVESVKPTGLLQQYGDVDADRRVRFGLITGSYNKNTDGGVLRKNIKLFTNNQNTALGSASICGNNNAYDEVDVCTGQFINQGSADKGIVKTINALRIADWKYNFSGGLVASGSYDTCDPGNLLNNTNNTCRDWGNPLSEMYYEALRYFAGKTGATAGYATASDSSYIAGLQQDTWDASSDPLPATEWCAISNIITLSTGLNSLDTNTFAYDIAGLGSADVNTLTAAVGTAEGLSGNYFIGSNSVDNNYICTAKSLASLDKASGICPEIPQLKGGYKLAGLGNANRSVDLRPGYLANRTQRWTGIEPDWVVRQPIKTYAIALAETLPSFDIPVGGGVITLVPACRSGGTSATGDNVCSLTDLRVEDQTSTSGRFLASWEDRTAGGDYDMDAVSRIEYRVVGAELQVSVSVVQAATGATMKLGYTISGTAGYDKTHYLINIQSTGDGGTTCSDVNKRQFSLISNPPSYGVNCATEPATSTCSYTNYLGNLETVKIPTGVKTSGSYACVKPDGTAGSDCGCPKTWNYTPGSSSASFLKNPLWYAAKYGASAAEWDVKNNLTGAAGADGIPDNYFDVRNPAKLYDSLAEVFDAASQPDASASSVATNSTNLQTQSRVFQAKFSSADWSGQVLSFAFVSGTSALNATPEWDAGVKINDLNPSSGRVIITKGASGGVAFDYANLTAADQTSLNKNFNGVADNCGPERVAYLRGDQTNEGSVGTFACASTNVINKFRPRSASRLGDVVNSSPWFVAEPKAGFSDVDHPGYAAYRSSRKNRLPVVYVGGNDGMLHGFDASLDFSTLSAGVATAHAGNEVLAYVPSAVMANLSKLTDLKYNKNHQYFADGSPMVGDAYLPTLTTTDKWRSVLIAGLGAGGKGYYALDVSNPGSVDNAGTVTAGSFIQTNAAELLLWEFDETDMGYSFNYPAANPTTNQAKQIVKMANGKWAAVVGNGYNSASGKAVLYILFIDEGRNGWADAGDFVKLVADVGPNNGLSTPIPFDSNGDGFADVVYAGDLKGNLWKFQVGPNPFDAAVTSDPATWKVAIADEAAACVTCSPLFSATDGGSPATAQPIIWPAEVTRHPDGGNMVLFGTGKYLETSDNGSSGVQSFYGIRDNGVVVTRANLVEQTVVAVVGKFRTTSSNAVDYATKHGWYINLPTSGERVTGVPKLDSGHIIFNTLIPSTSPCESGGTGWLMTLNYLNGNKPVIQLFDTNNDGVIDSNDDVVSGYQVGAALGGSTLIPNEEADSPGVVVSSLTSGALDTTLMRLGGGERGRITWREILR